mmetsp:Transcript_21420/g.51458  ORF Transcript_21420/g.51458 Transcript_21420/m.51458 type:complete len:243 (-) Transcript_21420:117-845(-)
MPSLSILNTSSDAPTTAGAIELEKRYGRAFCRSMPMISLRPVEYPPVAPPSALPSVELITSTDASTPKCSGVPLPVGPKKPVAWHSSTNTCASYLRASAQISSSGATSPSIEKAPSVAMRRERAPCAAMSFSSRSAMLRCSYLKRLALHSRIPSMIDAWLSASESTASSSVRMVSKRPALASKQEGKRMVSSVPWKAEMASSSCLWMSCVPQMKRTLDMPSPCVASVCCATWTSRGWLERPR